MTGAPLGDLVPPPEASLQGAWGLDLTQEPGTRVTPCPVSAGPCAHCPWEPGGRGRPSPSVRPTGRLDLPKGQPRVARALSIRARWVLAGPQLRATPHVPPGRGDAAAASRGPRAPRDAGTARGSSPGRRPQTGAGGGGLADPDGPSSVPASSVAFRLCPWTPSAASNANARGLRVAGRRGGY